jgi:hypothetical protein
MHPLKTAVLSLARLARQVGSLPHTLALALKRWRQNAALDALEADRLDRIRNPTKYLGKS